MQKNEVIDVIKNFIIEIAPGLTLEEISVDHSLSDLGLNSVDRAEILLLSQEHFALKMPLIEFAGVRTIDALAVKILSGLNTQ